MQPKNPFFKKIENIELSRICKELNVKNIYEDCKIEGINNLENANNTEISFFNSLKYTKLLNTTKSKFIITKKKYENLILKFCSPIIVDDILKSVGIVTSLFYPDSLNDSIDFNVNKKNQEKYNNVKFGSNVLLGNNITIGANCSIGHNTIIESNVKIGTDCIIGNNVLIKNSFIGNNVIILDGSIIGKKGFGFFPSKDKNFRYPHVGMVIIGNDVEIGSNNNIDRGSISNTIIGDNTFLDNMVHIAHNVKIGKNCIITAQVGFAGSTTIGNRVSIGGQAGISGHLNIGNNVQIGGGSGVIKNIPDNSKVMGYPAKNIRSFLKNEN